MEETLQTLSLDALVRSVHVNRGAPHAVFLGAGTSISSGVSTASACIWEWKRQIFLTKNVGLEAQFKDLSTPCIQERIQRWIDGEAIYPAAGSAEEYGRFAELCYPIADDRRQFFQNLAANAKPFLGYHLLCLLAEAGIIKATWTTNFDSLVPKAAANYKIVPIEAGLNSASRTIRKPRDGELLCVALHGDYRYDELKNTDEELRSQNCFLANAFHHYVKDVSLIVIGYSGRDDSIMEMMARAYSRAGAGSLYWCGHEQPSPDDRVVGLLATAVRAGRKAYYVPASGFDDLMQRLALHCLEGDRLAEARKLWALHVDRTPPPAFSVPSKSLDTLIRSNMFAIQCPSEVLQFKCQGLEGEGAWDRLRDIVRGTNVVAGLLRGVVLALGTLDDVKAAFAGRIEGEIKRAPIDQREFSYENGVVSRLLTDALVRCMAQAHGLNTDGKALLWSSDADTKQEVYGTRCVVHQAAILRLRLVRDRLFLVVKPTIKGAALDGSELDEDTEDELKRQVLTHQWNLQFVRAVNFWLHLLLPDPTTRYEWPPNAGSTFTFSIQRATALGRISTPRPQRYVAVAPKVESLCLFEGTRYEEPRLLFSNKRGDGFVTDTHPIRGIVNNLPYDHALAARNIVREVRLGIVCPKPDAERVSRYLSLLHQRRTPTSKTEYLLEYPGFSQAFGIPITVPIVGSAGWGECSEPPEGADVVKGARTLRESIIASIDAIKARSNASVVVIYVPERWKPWERYATDDERFNLHDFVKAYCVQAGIATQFLRETTLKKRDQAEIEWWLALSFYAKSMLTPWVLDPLDTETAFMGLGYSVNPYAPKGKKVVLGCSHIYSADGKGLRYRLRKLDDVFFDRQRNPFMKRDDARRLGESVSQLFFESMGDLPKRVVVHKRTYFRHDERDGLLEGLRGIEEVDMVEINEEPMLRFTASKYVQNDWKSDNFPVKRGTALVMGDDRALLWVHGTALSIDPSKPSFYLGKSRIPAPLTLIRHHGRSELAVLAREILGLSKMNWNTFDMYTRVPATIQSSNAIAEIGALLERFGDTSYDYRLFI